MMSRVSRSMANEAMTKNAWKAVASALEGTHGIEEWDVLGGQGNWWSYGQMWAAKCVLTSPDPGSQSISLPRPAYNTIVSVVDTAALTEDLVFVGSGDTVTVTIPASSCVIIEIRPTLATE